MIKFAELQVQDSTALAIVMDVMRSGRFINGSFNQIFAEMWAKECNADSCVLTASGTASLVAALKLVKLKNTFGVIMPALSFAATAFAAMEAGLTPVYVDVDEHGLMRWDQAEEALYIHRNQVAAILPVHLYGQVLSTPAHIHDEAVVIDDACQAHGAFRFDDQPDIAAFSFYPAKNLGAIGDAGALVFKNVSGYAERVAAYINYGDYPREKYKHNFQGNNLRCDEIQAAYLSIAYRNLAENNLIRQAVARTYEGAGVASYANSDPSSWHLYPILVDKPDQFRRLMIDYGVETGNHYPYALPDVANGIIAAKLTQAYYIAKHVVTLPIGPHMGEKDAYKVVDVIHHTCELRDNLWCIKES